MAEGLGQDRKLSAQQPPPQQAWQARIANQEATTTE